MRNRVHILIILPVFLFFCIPFLYSEDKKTDSLKEDRIETIKYGIDSEIINLISDLKEEKNTDFNPELLKLLETSSNNKLKETIISFFADEKDDSAVKYAFDEIKNNYSLSNEAISKYIDYISDYQTPEITKYLLTLINHDDNTVSYAAIDALGKSGDSSCGKELLDMLNDPETDDNKKIHIIGALGKLKYSDAVDSISKFLEKDYTDNRSLKWKACAALGEIGDEKSLPVIKKLFSDKDPYLRRYAVEALGNFPKNKIEDTVIQGLRDSSWRVRVSAASSLGKLKSKKAVPMLIYKANKDPDVKNVRNAAIKALAEIGTKEADDFLHELVLDDKTNPVNRSTAVSALVKHDLDGSLDTFDKLFDKEWDKSSSYILDYTCKLLSQQKDSKLKKFYERMMTYNKTANIKIYALRGIKLNKMTSLKDKVSKLAEDDPDKRIKRLAEDVLSTL